MDFSDPKEYDDWLQELWDNIRANPDLAGTEDDLRAAIQELMLVFGVHPEMQDQILQYAQNSAKWKSLFNKDKSLKENDDRILRKMIEALKFYVGILLPFTRSK